MNNKKKIAEKKMTSFPMVTIAVPVYNEEKSVVKTIASLLALDYPKDKLEILVINDGSTDNTRKEVEEFLKINKCSQVRLISQENQGKGAALNNALEISKGEYFAVFDADSLTHKDALKFMLPHFDEENVGAVISAIKTVNNKTIVERIQRLEYIFSSFVRGLMSSLGTLHITHGVLSIFRTRVLKEVKGFDETNLTEDFEIAMRLRKNHYAIRMCERGWNYTHVPSTIKELWVQRVRWFRGYIKNNLTYRGMVMNKKYGLLGKFQIPLELLMLSIMFFSIGLISYKFFSYTTNLYWELSILRTRIFDFTIPTIKEFILNLNLKLMFPTTVTFIAGFYLYVKAHQHVDEKWKFHLSSMIYLMFYPLIRSVQWMHALALELAGAKKKWR